MKAINENLHAAQFRKEKYLSSNLICLRSNSNLIVDTGQNTKELPSKTLTAF